jgi:hypothetical protein
LGSRSGGFTLRSAIRPLGVVAPLGRFLTQHRPSAVHPLAHPLAHLATGVTDGAVGAGSGGLQHLHPSAPKPPEQGGRARIRPR